MIIYWTEDRSPKMEEKDYQKTSVFGQKQKFIETKVAAIIPIESGAEPAPNAIRRF